ncbi:TIGR01621 family pseudouridine synthase [Desulfovibrionales bacterium]
MRHDADLSGAQGLGVRVVGRGSGFLVINKDAGLDMHSRNDVPGLCALVRELCGLASVWPVHRLDKDTSGLVLVATTVQAARDLGALFQNQQVSKYYVCLSDLSPRKKQGLVQGDMVRSRCKTWKLCRSMTRPARTRFLSWSVYAGLRLFVLRPLTGKTHQLRVAMKALGSPILGDRLYHPHTSLWPDRLYLHAHTLRFCLYGQEWIFRCPPDTGRLFQDSRVLDFMQDFGPLDGLSWPDSWPAYPQPTVMHNFGT